MGAPLYGRFGNSADSAVRTEFFSWFHLTEAGAEERGDGSKVARFRPGNPDFRPMVLCELHCDADGVMTCLAVEISGTFIDDVRTWAFARDLAASFLRDGLVYQADADEVADVLRDLRHRPQDGATHHRLEGADPEDVMRTMLAALDRGEQLVAFRGRPGEPEPELPAVVSRGFAVYCGDRVSYRRNLTFTRFAMETVTVDGGRVLRMSFEPLTRPEHPGKG